MKIREVWPDVEISFRGDAGFQKPYIYHWCEKNGVTFITGVISNTTLRKKACKLMLKAEKAFQPWWDSFNDHLVYGLIMLGKGITSSC